METVKIRRGYEKIIDKTFTRCAPENSRIPILLNKLSNYKKLSKDEKAIVRRFFAKSNRSVRENMKEMQNFRFCYNEGDIETYNLVYLPENENSKAHLSIYNDISIIKDITILADGIIDTKELLSIIRYSEFLDTIARDNIEKQLIGEIGKCIIDNCSDEGTTIWGRVTHINNIRKATKQLKELPIYNRLKESYNNLKQEVGEIPQQEETQYDDESEFYDCILFDLTETRETGNCERSELMQRISFDTSKNENSNLASTGEQAHDTLKGTSEDKYR